MAKIESRPPRLYPTLVFCTRVDGLERRRLKTITLRCWIPVNAHASIKDGGWAKTIKRRNVWTRFCLKTEERTLRFQTKTDVCGPCVDFQRPTGITDGMNYILVRLKNILGSFSIDHF